ncbi:MAG TPA: serine/threonine-protein kinase [Longimicrobium sp.]|nr:serine/threonine-protein kinase [Longimicrobium sp.]
MPTQSTDPAPPAGELLGGRYELLEPIGHGGMSRVYRAHDRTLDRPVAVKVIQHDPAAHGDLERMRARFRREAANAARIPAHPNVVQIYDYGTDPAGDRDYIVMELLRGRDLKAVLRERRPGEAEAVHIILEAARGLAAGHRAGIIHRDVKPANLLLTGEGTHAAVRVLDFGIAKALEGDPDDDLTQAGHVPHTPAYASPEQMAWGRALSPASDVYQLGQVAYELLAGERPFDADDRERMARGEDVPLPRRGDWERVPARVRAVVERALRPDPAERYPDAAAFAEALAAAPADDDHTLLAAGAPADATATMGPAPGYTVPVTRGEHGVAERWRAIPRAARIGLAAVAALLLLWIALPGRGDAPAPDAGTIPEARSTAELEEEFAPLYREAAERLAEEDEAEAP